MPYKKYGTRSHLTVLPSLFTEEVTARTMLVNNNTAIDLDKQQTDIVFTCVEPGLQSLCTYNSNVG